MAKRKSQGESKQLKTKSISIRMTVAEMDKIDKFAAEFNLPTGMYMRLCSLLGYLPYAVTRSGPTVQGGVKRVRSVTEISGKLASRRGRLRGQALQG